MPSLSVPATPPVCSPQVSTLLVPIAVWFTMVTAAALSGALAALGRVFMPGYALLVALGIAVPVIAYYTLPGISRAVDSVTLHRLTLMHVWRIPAALVFFYYGAQGALPPAFWILAGIGDLLAGMLAATLLWREPTLARYRFVNAFGFADFLVAVGTGLTFTLLRDPRMTLLTTLPMAWIPLFGVGLSGAAHVIAWSMLSRRSDRTG